MPSGPCFTTAWLIRCAEFSGLSSGGLFMHSEIGSISGVRAWSANDCFMCEPLEEKGVESTMTDTEKRESLHELSDAELNRRVSEVLWPSISAQDLVVWEEESWDVSDPGDFCTNPSAWGWLLEREAMSLWHDDYTWKAITKSQEHADLEAYSGIKPWSSSTPGRAVCIAFLESVDE